MNMTEQLQALRNEWDKRDGPAVLTTVDSNGKPNTVYVAEIQYDPEIGFIVADNYFDKTRRNIKSGSPGTILFLTKQRKPYQAKGTLSYHTNGPIYEKMLEKHNPEHPGVAATVLKVEELYSGAKQLM